MRVYNNLSKVILETNEEPLEEFETVNCYTGNLSRHRCLFQGGSEWKEVGGEREREKENEWSRENVSSRLRLLCWLFLNSLLLNYQITSDGNNVNPSNWKTSEELGKEKSRKGKGNQDLLLVFEYIYCDKNAVINIHKQRPSLLSRNC